MEGAGKSHHQSPGRLSRPQEEGSHKEALLGWRGAVSSSGPAPGSKFPWGCFNMFQHVSKFLFPVLIARRKPYGKLFQHLAGPSGPREEAKTDDRLMEEQEQQRQEKFSAGLRFLTFRWSMTSCEVTTKCRFESFEWEISLNIFQTKWTTLELARFDYRRVHVCVQEFKSRAQFDLLQIDESS